MSINNINNCVNSNVINDNKNDIIKDIINNNLIKKKSDIAFNQTEVNRLNKNLLRFSLSQRYSPVCVNKANQKYILHLLDKMKTNLDIRQLAKHNFLYDENLVKEKQNKVIRISA